MENLSYKELRIGNYLNVFYKEEIKEIHTVEIATFSMFLDGFDLQGFYFEPIALTEEWLLRFGIEKYEFDHKNNQYRFKDRLLVIREGLFCDYGTSVVIKTVHQLQNLYFALTGTELTLIK